MPQQTFGQYTAIHDVRQGPEANGGEFHESLTSLAAILGGGLNGIDKTNQNGYNFVKMVQNYFNSDNGWNIVMNNTNPDVANLGGGYGRDWWYDVLPNCLYYAVSDVFPGVPGAEEIQRTVAEQFYRAGEVLGENYDYSYFDYGTMTPHVNHIPLQQDAAGATGMCSIPHTGNSGTSAIWRGRNRPSGRWTTRKRAGFTRYCFRWVSIRPRG